MNKISANSNNTLFIIPGKGFSHEGVASEGYKSIRPYVEPNILFRIFREICFRCKFLPHKIWFNKVIKERPYSYIIVHDPLITREFLDWVKSNQPHAQLNYIYTNMVGKSRHLFPDEIPDSWRIWTYDDHDGECYGLRVFHENAYFKSFVKQRGDVEYDVLFVGRDKGRGEYLLQLEKRLNELNLKTKFIITADGRLSRRKAYYQKEISYKDLINLIVKSRAILNISMPNQKGITMRDLESIFLGVKLITTNKNIINTDIYNPDNVYIINDSNIDDLPDFLNKEYVPTPQETLMNHSFSHFLDIITSE